MSILDKFALTDHVAIVTGAGRGLGAATAVALAEAGADVVVSARTPEQLDEVAARIRQAGRRALVVPADLSDTDALGALPEAAINEFGRLDTIVNNVGGAMPKEFLRTNVAAMESAFHFNVSTAHALTRAALPHLLVGEGEKSVVNISSMVGRTADRGYIAYGTAKAALSHWTRLAAADFAPHVRVNGIHVGSILTSALDVVAQVPELQQQLVDRTPLGRIGDPDDIAAAVLYLASPASSYVTGKLLEVDGGIQEPNLSLGFPDLERT